MSDITLIAADKASFSLGHELSVRLFPEVLVIRGVLGEGVAAAANQIRQGTAIIVSRGATAKAIQEAFPALTHVTIQRTAFDYIRALSHARSVGGSIAAVTLPHLVNGLTTAAHAMDLSIRLYPIFTGEEVEPTILRAVDEGASIITGSSSTGLAARRLKVPHVVVQSGEESIIAALAEARRILETMREGKVERSLLHAAVDAADSGIVAMDRSGRVMAFNTVAERMCGTTASDALGKYVSELWPEFDFKAAMRENSTPMVISRKGNEDVIGLSRPVKTGEGITGVVVSFQDMDRLRVLASSIRKRVGAGHVARTHFNEILGSSPAITRAIAMAKRYAKTDSTVFIVGETGTGKELFAQSIHNQSVRSARPFVAVNCAALPGSLLESELFGYVPGAFTGASGKGKAGLFELADGGTIFLDEVTEMEPHTQAKLLRVLQEKQVMRLGSDTITPFDVRVVAASNKEMSRLLDSGSFRTDLYYRLNVLMLNLPSLRERQEDIPHLCRYFLKQQSANMASVPSFTPEALRQLCAWPWHGNIRELQNVMNRVTATAGGRQVTEDTIRRLLGGVAPVGISRPPATGEKETIRQALVKTGGKKAKAAEALGISRATLWRKMRELELVHK